jgi:hypothetical protein
MRYLKKQTLRKGGIHWIAFSIMNLLRRQDRSWMTQGRDQWLNF